MAGQSVSRSVSQSVGRSVGQSVGRSVSQSVGHGQSVCRSVGQSVDRSVKQSFGRSVSQLSTPQCQQPVAASHYALLQSVASVCTTTASLNVMNILLLIYSSYKQSVTSALLCSAFSLSSPNSFLPFRYQYLTYFRHEVTSLSAESYVWRVPK
jgi:hypothetical protein